MVLSVKCVFLLLSGYLVLSPAKSDDGLCSVEGPAPDGSCSGTASSDEDATTGKKSAATTYEYQERLLTPEEADVWARRFYKKMAFTDEVDWPIREELDFADEFIVPEPEKAFDLFETILAAEPRSVRAFYAQTRAMQFRNATALSKDAIDDVRRDCIMRFRTLLDKPEEDVLAPIWYSAASQALATAGALNDTAVTVSLYEHLLSTRHQDSGKHLLALLHEHFLHRRWAEAEVVTERALKVQPGAMIFNFFKGILLKLTDRKKEGNRLLRSLELDPANTFDQANELLHLGYLLLVKGHTEEMEIMYQEASKLHLYISKLQRPLEAYDDLESKPIWSVEDTGLTTHDEEFETLTSAWKEIRLEALQLASNLSEWTNSTHHLAKGGWYQYPLYSWGKRRLGHCVQTPKTCALLKAFTAVSRCSKCVARFDLVQPGSHIYAHTGPTNTNLRVHLGLQVPKEGARMRVGKGSFVHWEEGKLSVFDNSYEHEEWNNEEQAKIVLAFDVQHPDLPFNARKGTYTPSGKYQFESY